MSPVEPALVPAPRTVEEAAPGGFPLTPDTPLWAGPGTGTTERWLRSTLGPALGLRFPPGTEDTRDGLRLRLDDTLAPEAYRLAVLPGRGVEIAGGGPAGVFWGAQTLRQLLGPDAFRKAPVRPGATRTVPHRIVEDEPRFRWRGLMLDVARHFMPKEGVLRYLDLMAAHKLNVLHFHLTDDQGWRIEIERYPRLTETGSWRARTKLGHRASPLWNDTPHGGHYTQDDIREIVAYAAERHIAVVPEIDVPGHSQAAIAAYPELGNTDVVDTSSLTVWDTWGINPNVLAPTDTTLRFYEGVLEEVLELFPADATGPSGFASSPPSSPSPSFSSFSSFSSFVHIGGDECPKDQWRASDVAQKRIADLGLADEDALQSWFIGHFAGWLAERGRRLIGWDEILQGGLAPGAAVSSWRGYAGGVAAARAGHDVVMCPEQHVYLDHRQDAGPEEPVPIGYVRTLEDVYRFEPVPTELTPEDAGRVLGTQANAWSEVTENQARVDYQVFPRLAALAEVAWSALPAPAERDFAGFERRMAAHYRRLDALGVAYRPPAGPLPWQRRPGVLGRPVDGAPPQR
ncbi:beta-N-acetylhexosaminidase [Streptomyces hirsutus]|uniref:beta-N-acetylhexosaminidase n=1 Tax=Streptomyces hirsutus TaxID=35620 RepID=UPI00343B35B8